MKHNILIQWSDNGGVILQVGCKTLVFELLGQALVEVEKYAKDPQGTYNRYADTFGWAKEAFPGAVETPQSLHNTPGEAFGLPMRGTMGGVR